MPQILKKKKKKPTADPQPSVGHVWVCADPTFLLSDLTEIVNRVEHCNPNSRLIGYINKIDRLKGHYNFFLVSNKPLSLNT